MTVQLQPLGNRLLVRVKSLERPGLILQPFQRDYAREMEVLRCGPEVRDIQEGMTILAPAVAGQQVGDAVLIPESSVLAVI